MSATNKFSAQVEGFATGTPYQYRAVVASPKITLRGDPKRVTAR